MKKTLITALILFLFNANTALAKTDTDHVQKFVQHIGDQIITIANNEEITADDRKNGIIKVIDEAIDAKWISRFVLGKSYRKTKIEHKAKFTKLYRQFMINTYGPKFQNYNGKSFTVTSVRKQGRFYIAKADFLPKDSKTPILVAFRVKERKGHLMILDFIAEGISLIETQRSEFNSAISRNGMEKFLEDLEERIKKLKEPEEIKLK